jgi:diguanylate cyclase (GGDEF)-like protein
MDTTKKISAADEKRIKDIVFHECVKILYDNLSATSIPAHLICASILFVGLFSMVNKSLIIGWYVCSYLVSILRIYFIYLYKCTPTKYRMHLILFIIGSTISAITWSVASTIFVSEADMNGLMLTIVIITGITAGGSQTLQASLFANVTFMVIVIFPLTVCLVRESGHIFIALSIGVMVYLLFMLQLAKNGYMQLVDSIRLRNTNILLAKQLSDINKNLMNEIFEHKKTQEQLNYLAMHDILTKIPNLHYFNLLFQQTMARANRHMSKFSVLFVDVDHFKFINDTYGHDIGDKVLYQSACLLKQTLRSNEIIARIGGDEFVILLEDLEAGDMDGKKYTKKFITRIYDLFKTPLHINHHDLSITLSIGVSIYPRDGKDKQSLMKNADIALYRAKKLGRNRAEFYQSVTVT